MPTFNDNIIALTTQNSFFRQEIVTNDHSQLVVMSIEPGDEIGLETHDLDQVLVFVQGKGKAILDGVESAVENGSLVVVPSGVEHNFVNTGGEPLKLFTLYCPPEHEPGTIHRDKAEADAAEHHH